MSRLDLEKLLEKYQLGQCSPDEEIFIQKYFESFQDENENWSETKFGSKGEIEDRIFSKIMENINTRRENANVKIFNSTYLLRVAASIILFAFLCTGSLYILGVFNEKPVSITWNEKTTSLGQKLILTLLDGTKITLNADSKLKYPTKFGKESREVYLQGEAYFEVVYKPNKPFIVRSGDISTTVLGTKFNVSAFPGEKNISVSLVEGKVKVSKKDTELRNEEVILAPDQQLLYSKETGTSKVNQFDFLETVGWKDNILVFNNELLEIVMVKLERYFGIEFKLEDDSFRTSRIKANFKNESFWAVVEVIKYTTGLEYKTLEESGELEKIIFYNK